MALAIKMWSAIATVIRMNDKVADLADCMKAQQLKIESLNERLIRLETLLEVARARQGVRTLRQMTSNDQF